MGRAEDLQHTIMVGTIAQMPAEDQAKVHEIAAKLRTMLMGEDGTPNANPHAIMAVALVGAELAKDAP